MIKKKDLKIKCISHNPTPAYVIHILCNALRTTTYGSPAGGENPLGRILSAIKYSRS